jgi:hypothetical protein
MLAIGLTGACSSPPAKDDALTNHTRGSPDDELVSAVRDAVRSKVAPAAIATRVGRKPTIDTTAGFPIAALGRVYLVEDPDHSDEHFDRSNAAAVIYWVRDVPGKNPHVVGAQARADGTTAVFFAIVLPPD